MTVTVTLAAWLGPAHAAVRRVPVCWQAPDRWQAAPQSRVSPLLLKSTATAPPACAAQVRRLLERFIRSPHAPLPCSPGEKHARPQCSLGTAHCNRVHGEERSRGSRHDGRGSALVRPALYCPAHLATSHSSAAESSQVLPRHRCPPALSIMCP